MQHTRALTFGVLFSLAACGGQAAVEDLQKLKDKTCACEDGDDECIDEAKTMAQEWVEKHKNARGGDQQKAEKLAMELMNCSLDVAMMLSE